MIISLLFIDRVKVFVNGLFGILRKKACMVSCFARSCNRSKKTKNFEKASYS